MPIMTGANTRSSQTREVEKSLVVGLFAPNLPEFAIRQVLTEMKLLTQSAGGDVLETFFQKRRSPDKRTLIGRGKAAEIKNYACARDVNLIVFYNHLSNVQQRNLEKFFKMKVIDRTRLILDIFATRARTLEGKLQVELAQLLYLLPRLTGRGIELSRLGGGIGTRGPGETKLEADRRTIKKKISIIRRRLDKVIKSRDTRRKSRLSNPIPVVSLVGYTSAGKSTLFNALTGEDVTVSRMLFSTLDPVLRRVDMSRIREGCGFLLSDTVGFIRDMPGELFEAFKATLEEMVHSDLILHVIDISDPDYLDRKDDVMKVLAKMNIPNHKIIHVYNKIDLLPENPVDSGVPAPLPNSRRVFTSATKQQGLPALKQVIHDNYFNDYENYTLSIPQHLVNPDSLKRWAIVLGIGKPDQNQEVQLEILCSTKNMLQFKEKYGGYVQ